MRLHHSVPCVQSNTFAVFAATVQHYLKYVTSSVNWLGIYSKTKTIIIDHISFHLFFFQMSPEVYSPQARQLGLQKSLAERLFDLYSREDEEHSEWKSNVLFLTENYRCHKEILNFPSYNFYGDKLIARGCHLQPAHPTYGPLLFFSARGREKKEHDNSYINLSEVDEVVKRVKEVANHWPTHEWGQKKLSEIAVLSSYRYQVRL